MVGYRGVMRDDFQPRLGANLFEEAAEHLASRIEAGTLTGQLPALPALADDYGVSVDTMRRSVAILRDRGLVVVNRPKGTFVVPPSQR